MITRTLIVVDHEVLEGEPKTDAGARTVRLDDKTVATLKAHRAQVKRERMAMGLGGISDDLLAFAEVDGSWPHPEYVSEAFTRRSKRYKLPHIGVHGLRHTWATLALLAGEHPRVVQSRLGHSTVAVTLGIYSHVSDGMDADAASRVAALFDEVAGS